MRHTMPGPGSNLDGSLRARGEDVLENPSVVAIQQGLDIIGGPSGVEGEGLDPERWATFVSNMGQVATS